MTNIGGYDEHSFNESDGISKLMIFLHQKKNIKANLLSGDKIPNLDGNIQLLEKSESKSIPKRIFHVQVKTLNHDYSNMNTKGVKSQYKYSEDTKVFNVVKENITSDPVLLFLVDVIKNKIFYKYISFEYVISLDFMDENYITIYFNDDDEIKDIDAFHATLLGIHEKQKMMRENIKENRITTTFKKNTEMYKMLQQEWEYLDNLLMKTFRIATNFLFPDVWKFGIAYQEGERFNTIGIYKIKYGDNGTFCREYSENESECFNITRYARGKTNIREIIYGQVTSFVKKYTEIGRIPVNCLPNIVLEEISFFFLDLVAHACDIYEDPDYMQIYYKREEKTYTIRRFWNAIISWPIDDCKKLIKQHPEVANDSFDINPFEGLLSWYPEIQELSKRKFLKVLESEGESEIMYKLPFPFEFSKDYNYLLFAEVINELEERKIDLVKRPWKPKKMIQMFEQYKKLNLQGFDRKETGFLIEDIYSNSEKILCELPGAYNFTARKIWEQFNLERLLKGQYSFIYNKSNYDCRYFVLVKEGEEFSIELNKHTEEEIQLINHQEKKLVDFEAKGLLSSSFYLSCSLQMPLYENIFHLVLKEMWDKSMMDEFVKFKERSLLAYRNKGITVDYFI